MKELKKLAVAGPATAEEIKKEFFVQWHLTERCNLACRHCYQSGNGTTEMDISAVQETAEEVAEMLADWTEKYAISFTGSLNVTGGEPLVRKDLFEVLRLMREQGFEISLLTNGTLVDREKAEELRGLVRLVQVSIEGPEPVHDAIRGKGAYKKAVTGVENMLASGIFVSLNITISRLNVEYLSDLVLLGRELGVGRVGFSRLVPAGRGAALAKEMVDGEQLRQIYLSLLSLGDEAMETGTGDPLAALLHEETADAGETAFGGCAAGVSGLTLLPDGTLTPCRRMPIPLGNVARDSIRQIWTESPVLTLLRDKGSYTGRCGRCPRWAACRGCRAVAYACAPSGGGQAAFLGDDPQCFSALADGD